MGGWLYICIYIDSCFPPFKTLLEESEFNIYIYIYIYIKASVSLINHVSPIRQYLVIIAAYITHYSCYFSCTDFCV